MHHASLGSHPPDDDDDELLLDDELLPELLELPGGGLSGSSSGELTNSLPRHSPVSVTKQTLASKVDDGIKFGEERS